MSKFIIYIVFRLFSAISSILSIEYRNKFGKILGSLMFLLSKDRRKITLQNLKFAFPDFKISELKKLRKDAFDNLGITFSELLVYHKIKKIGIDNYIEYENIELITKLKARNKGLILLSGHFGNWEYLAYSAGYYTQNSVLIVVKRQKNVYIDNFINQCRVQSGNRIVDMFGAAKHLVKELRNGGIIALLADQSASKDKDIYVDFFGRDVPTFETPAVLALKFNVPIVVGFAVRQFSGKYKVRLQELVHSDLQYNKDGVIELTKRHVKLLEEGIRAHPELWAWQHKRWKHSH